MNINDVIVQNKARKRGRPRKNSILPTKSKSQHDKKSDIIEEDIIIHFPISSKEVNNEKVNGFELIQTECNEDASSSDTDLTDDESSENNKSRQQLLNIIKEKDKIIAELEEKLILSNDTTECSHSIPKNVKLYPLNVPFDTSTDDNIIVPEYTNKACLWDTCEINGVPCFLPDKYYDGKFYVVGWFCSLNCATAYNLHLDDFKVSERYSLLKLLYGKTQDSIEPSPSYRILDKFGGKISIDDYRKNLNKCDKEYRIIMPPMTCVYQTLEERIHKPVRGKPGREKNTIIDAMKHKAKL
jgi:hypothetical protein